MKIIGEKAKEISKPRLKEVLESGYGIFSCQSVTWGLGCDSSLSVPVGLRMSSGTHNKRGSLNLMEVIDWRFRTKMTESY